MIKQAIQSSVTFSYLFKDVYLKDKAGDILFVLINPTKKK